MSTYQQSGKDLYKVLRISQSASIHDIKTSYRKIAMELHPDKNNGCLESLARFKEVNEAYAILADISKRKEYDTDIGIRTKKNRSSPLPKDYRKVYAPRPPPDWKFTWDHVKHYEMHYGDGFKKEAIKDAKRQAEKDGQLEYLSPLGKGFSFSSDRDREGHENPYSRNPQQGPSKIIFDYEEGHVCDATMGKIHVTRREHIIEDLHSRRSARHNQQQHQMDRHQRFHGSSYHPMGTAADKMYSRKVPSNECIIL
jgi:curved DNA-binding protein CbpA